MTQEPPIADVYVGKVYFFGLREVPNQVISVGTPYPTGDVPVRLRGPRGGESRATVVASTGNCIKYS